MFADENKSIYVPNQDIGVVLTPTLSFSYHEIGLKHDCYIEHLIAMKKSKLLYYHLIGNK